MISRLNLFIVQRVTAPAEQSLFKRKGRQAKVPQQRDVEAVGFGFCFLVSKMRRKRKTKGETQEEGDFVPVLESCCFSLFLLFFLPCWKKADRTACIRPPQRQRTTHKRQRLVKKEKAANTITLKPPVTTSQPQSIWMNPSLKSNTGVPLKVLI